MNENEFTHDLVAKLIPHFPHYEIEAQKSLLYSITIDEKGTIQTGLNSDREPVRGGGKGFQQDVVVYEIGVGDTTIIPRVVAEIKYEGVTTHDTLVYSEKARRLKEIYPYL